MATAKKKAQAQRKPRRRLIPKLLVLLSSLGLIGFIVLLFIMEQELRRVGFFSSGNAPTRPAVQSPTPDAKGPAGAVEKMPSEPPAKPSRDEDISHDDKKRLNEITARTAEDLSRDERRQLDDILRARGGKQ
jgi:hypothetical protein